jgi:hypothetical protein
VDGQSGCEGVGTRRGAQEGWETSRPVESQMPGRWMAVTGRQLLYWNLVNGVKREGGRRERKRRGKLTSRAKLLSRRLQERSSTERRISLKQEHQLREYPQ